MGSVEVDKVKLQVLKAAVQDGSGFGGNKGKSWGVGEGSSLSGVGLEGEKVIKESGDGVGSGVVGSAEGVKVIVGSLVTGMIPSGVTGASKISDGIGATDRRDSVDGSTVGAPVPGTIMINGDDTGDSGADGVTEVDVIAEAVGDSNAASCVDGVGDDETNGDGGGTAVDGKEDGGSGVELGT